MRANCCIKYLYANPSLISLKLSVFLESVHKLCLIKIIILYGPHAVSSIGIWSAIFATQVSNLLLYCVTSFMNISLIKFGWQQKKKHLMQQIGYFNFTTMWNKWWWIYIKNGRKATRYCQGYCWHPFWIHFIKWWNSPKYKALVILVEIGKKRKP